MVYRINLIPLPLSRNNNYLKQTYQKYIRMKIIDNELLNKTSEAAKASPRLRMNHNFHDDTDDPLNRLINAIEPDSYIRPHRHLNPDKEEIFLLLKGQAALFLFDDEGAITETLLVSPDEGVYGAEIAPGIWHSLLVLKPDTVVYEVKRGPFAPLSADNLAPWSPPAEDTEAAASYMAFLRESLR